MRAPTARRTAREAARTHTTRAQAALSPAPAAPRAKPGAARPRPAATLRPPHPGQRLRVRRLVLVQPAPQRNVVVHRRGRGRTDLWIGGASSAVLHFDGGRWTSVSSPLSAVFGVWAAAEDDVWFGGTLIDTTPGDYFDSIAAIAHWDGVSLTLTAQFDDASVNDVWGAGPSDVYAAGTGDATWHWDGAAWTALPGVPGGTHVTGTGPNDVWLAGTGRRQSAALRRNDLVARPRAGIGAHRRPGRDRARRCLGHRPSRFQPHTRPALRWRRLAHRLRGHRPERDARGPGRLGDQLNVWLVGSVLSPGEEHGYVNHYDGRTCGARPRRRACSKTSAMRPGGDHRRGTKRLDSPARRHARARLHRSAHRVDGNAGGRVRQRARRYVGGRRCGDGVALRWARGQRAGGADHREPAGRVGQRPQRRVDRRHGRDGAALERAIVHAHTIGHDGGLAGGVHGRPTMSGSAAMAARCCTGTAAPCPPWQSPALRR